MRERESESSGTPPSSSPPPLSSPLSLHSSFLLLLPVKPSPSPSFFLLLLERERYREREREREREQSAPPLPSSLPSSPPSFSSSFQPALSFFVARFPPSNGILLYKSTPKSNSIPSNLTTTQDSLRQQKKSNRTNNQTKMSWLARSLANSLIADLPQDHEDGDHRSQSTRFNEAEEEPEQEAADPNRGVKEDLSELSQTLSRQFWGVASFISPPPPPPSISSALNRRSNPTVADELDRDEAATGSGSPRIAGFRNDFAEIGGRFRSGILNLSNNASIGRIASSFIPFGAEEDEEEEEEELNVIGVTEEVLAFARNISMHPETWLDFPLFNELEDTNDFEISDAQQEHALTVESLLPRLAALRIELCPTHMSEGCFWMIYFVLLHSRLSKQDAELLSTPQIAEARTMLLQKLQNRTKPDYEPSSRGQPYRNADITLVSPRGHVTSPSDMLSESNPANFYPLESPTSSSTSYFETEKHAEVEFFDKPVVEEDPATQSKTNALVSNFSEISIHDYYEDEDEWPVEEGAGVPGCMTISYGNAEDVSFSDLEDDNEQQQL